MPALPSDPAFRTHNLVLAEVARTPGISRSVIAQRLGVNLATVSRASRDLIDACMLEEAGKEVKGPGRPFIGLNLRGDGGYIVGIGVNAFRQSVTLANLRNEKLAEWISPAPPGRDGTEFLSMCVDHAARLLADADLHLGRFFGVGLAISAEIDRQAGTITEAPTFGWTKPIRIREMIDEKLSAPLAIETPSLAMTQAEAEFGAAQDARNIVTLHCSLGFGMGVRRVGDTGASADFGRVLTRARSATPNPELLDGLCGGVSVLNELEGSERIAQLSDSARGVLLSNAVERAGTDGTVSDILREKGRLTAQYFMLLLDALSPDLLLLAGPLAQAPDFVEGFNDVLADTHAPLEVHATAMTPTGASRWLSLRANVIHGDIDFTALKKGMAA